MTGDFSSDNIKLISTIVFSFTGIGSAILVPVYTPYSSTKLQLHSDDFTYQICTHNDYGKCDLKLPFDGVHLVSASRTDVRRQALCSELCQLSPPQLLKCRTPFFI